MKARPPLAVSTPSTSVSAPPPPSSSFVVQHGQNGVVSPPNYTVSSATVGPLTTPKCAYQTLPAVQYIQHPVSNSVDCEYSAFFSEKNTSGKIDTLIVTCVMFLYDKWG